MIISAATLTQAAAESTPRAGERLQGLDAEDLGADEAMIRPPADRPMKKAKVKMYIPQDTTSRIPVEERPFSSS